MVEVYIQIAILQGPVPQHEEDRVMLEQLAVRYATVRMDLAGRSYHDAVEQLADGFRASLVRMMTTGEVARELLKREGR